MKITRLFSLAITLCLPVLALSITAAAKTTVELKDAQGKSVGTAVLWSKAGNGAASGVFIKADLHDLPPGVHAFHFHRRRSAKRPILSRLARTSIRRERSTAWRIPKATTPGT